MGSPVIDIRLAPITQGVEDRPVHVEEGIPHASVALEGVRLGPVVPRWCRVREIRTGAVGIVPRAVGDTVIVLVCPVGGDATVVVFEVCTVRSDNMTVNIERHIQSMPQSAKV